MDNYIPLEDSLVTFINVIIITTIIIFVLTFVNKLFLSICKPNNHRHRLCYSVCKRYLRINWIKILIKISSWININMWKIVFLTIISALFLIFYRIFVYVFNYGALFKVKNVNILTSLDDWGSLATCLATMFTLFSVYWMYRAFRLQSIDLEKSRESLESQKIASARASFDATFTQIFAQHHILFEKVKCPKRNHCHFAEFRKFFSSIKYVRNDLSLTDIWERYNMKLEKECGEECPSNFRNFFKYIHREVTFIQDNFQNPWGLKSKKKYVRLIEGQLNNDELFSYFINQLEYCERHWDRKKVELEKYLEFLKANDFFKEICEETSFGYRKYVIEALNLLDLRHKDDITNKIINKEWLDS